MPSPYTQFVSRFVFPLHERLKGHDSVARLKALERSQWWDVEQIQALQNDKLKTLLVHCARNVPYYRDMFAASGFDPANAAFPDALVDVPVLTKALIRKHTDDLRANDAGALKRYNTGGSSGEPLVFYMGKDRISHDVAAKWRATRWWDVDIGDRELVVWGSPVELGNQDRVRIWRDRLIRSALLPAFEMSDAKRDSFIDTICASRPKMLFGYPSAFAYIADRAVETDRCLSDLGISVAFVTSERLYDHQRELIERVFGCPVANGYGGRDAGFIAHQCPHGSMHISAEDIVVETLDEHGVPTAAGVPGEITITHLCTRHFPFVRYRTGDIGVLGDSACACGRGLPLLSDIQGRTTDFIVAEDGTVMHGLALIYVLRDLAGIELFKIVQDTLTKVTVSLVVDAGYVAANDEVIRTEFTKRLGAGVEVRVEHVENIPAERSGKFRYVVSKVAPGSNAPNGVSPDAVTTKPASAADTATGHM